MRQRGVAEIVECTPHTLRRTYISRLLAAGRDPAYVQQRVIHTDPTLTLRIYQQLLKRKRREEFRERLNDLLGTSPAALSRRPEPHAKKRRAQFRAASRCWGRPERV